MCSVTVLLVLGALQLTGVPSSKSVCAEICASSLAWTKSVSWREIDSMTVKPIFAADSIKHGFRTC